MKSDLIDISCLVIRETEKAYLISDGGTGEHMDMFTGEIKNRERQIWVPKSLVEWDPDAKIMTMPERLAIEKGLV